MHTTLSNESFQVNNMGANLAGKIPSLSSNLGYVYTGLTEYLVGHILGQLSSRPKKGLLRHCVYTGPVSQVHDMRNTSSLLQAKGSVLFTSPQSIKQVGKRDKLACKWKGCEIKYILTDDKAFLLLVVMDVTSTKFLSLFDSNQTSELKIGGLGEGSDSSMLWMIQ